MMKNDIRYITLSTALAVIALAGCTGMQEKDLFEESPALRIENSADKLKEILVSAPNGWVMQYYTGDGVSVFEGFNLFARFENSGKVTIAGNHRFLRDGNKDKYTEASSLYELLREEGLVLSFNTWNDVLTPFVDPVSFWAAPENLYKDGEGMMGDQNLVVTSMSQSEIKLRGERYRGNVRLIRADRDWETYISDTEEMKNMITNDKIDTYYLTAGNELLYCVGLRKGRYRLSEKIDNYLKNDSLSCCFTPTGFYNEEPDTIAGHIFQEFKLNEDGSALVNEDGTVRLVATWDMFMAESTNIMWLDAESLSEDLKTKYDDIDLALTTANKNNSLSRIGIGKTLNGNNVTGVVVQWYTNARQTATKMGGMALIRTNPTYGQLKIESQPDVMDNEMKTKATGVLDALKAFGAALDGIYTMKPESYFVPSTTVFTSADGNKTFTLKNQ